MKKIVKKRKRYGSFGLVASLSTFVLIAAVYFTAHLAISEFSFGAPAKRLSRTDDVTGIIARQIGNQECAMAHFDNATGRTTEASGCKSTVALDADGAPVFRRLDAISKAFTGDTQ